MMICVLLEIYMTKMEIDIKYYIFVVPRSYTN